MAKESAATADSAAAVKAAATAVDSGTKEAVEAEGRNMSPGVPPLLQLRYLENFEDLLELYFSRELLLQNLSSLFFVQ